MLVAPESFILFSPLLTYGAQVQHLHVVALETCRGGTHALVLYLMGFSPLPARPRLNRRFRVPPALRPCLRGAGATQCLPWQPDGRGNEVLRNLAFSSGKALALVRLRRVTFLSSLSE
jgi:hypothetical protein